MEGQKGPKKGDFLAKTVFLPISATDVCAQATSRETSQGLTLSFLGKRLTDATIGWEDARAGSDGALHEIANETPYQI